MIAGHRNARQHIPQFGFIIDELQQGFAAGAAAADSEDVLGGRVQVDDEQVVIEQDDPGAQAVDYVRGVFVQRSVAGAAGLQRTVLCWT